MAKSQRPVVMDKLSSSACHRGTVNGGCVVVGRPHPSHTFIEPHPTVYEIAWATPKEQPPTDEILTDEKSMFASGRG